MAETIFVTEAQVKAAQMLVDRDRAFGREPDPATRWSMMAEALQDLPDVWILDRDEGLLTVVPPSIPTTEVMKRLLKELPGAIGRHNTSHHVGANFQLQLAVNVGPVLGDAAAVSGEAIDVASLLSAARRNRVNPPRRASGLVTRVEVAGCGCG